MLDRALRCTCKIIILLYYFVLNLATAPFSSALPALISSSSAWGRFLMLPLSEMFLTGAWDLL